MIKWWMWGPCAVLAALAWAAGEGTPAEPLPAATPVKVVTLVDQGGAGAPRFAGRVEAGDSAALAFRVAGQLRGLAVRMGEEVRQGDVLAELDATDYALNVQAREAEFELARLGAERATTLYARQLISEDEFDTARTRLTTSKARLEQARQQLSYCKLQAPFSGSVAFTYVRPGEVVGANQPVLKLQDTTRLDIVFNLPPQYQSLIDAPVPAVFHVVFDLFPELQLPAKYKEFSLQPDPDTNSYPMTLRIDKPEVFSPRPGMSVQVILYHPSLRSGLVQLPEEALFDRSGAIAHVWRIEESTMTVRRVAVSLNENLVVHDGLNPGDRIVAAGVDRLADGQKVRVWQREGGL